MAKKSEPAKPDEPARVRLDLPKSRLPELRIAAAEEGVSMAKYALTVVLRELDQRKGRKK